MTNALIVVAMPILLIVAGCSKPAEQTAKPAAADTMANMAMPTEAKSGRGMGKVTAIDAGTGKITLEHGPIAELQWPAMTMGFGVKPGMAKDIAVGDEVTFEFEWDGKEALVTSMTKR